MTFLAILLAAVGACCNAVSARLQHGGLQLETGGGGLKLRALVGLARRPIWITGVLVAAAGAALHATALGLAPISVVQPIGVLAFALSTMISVRVDRITLGRAAILAVLASMAGTIAFVLLAATSAKATQVTPAAAWHATELVLVVSAVLCAVGYFTGRDVRCLAFAAASGVLFGYVSLLMRAAIQQYTDGLGVPWLSAAGIVAGILIGGWLVQHAYASGPPEVVIGCLTVVDPLVAVGLGIALLGEGADTSALLSALEVACATVAVAGVVVLTQRRPSAPDQTNKVGGGERALVAPGITEHYDGSTK
ncbi:hypothetical protein GCM10010174_37730 [Kutzneria viridogrisea]|uniref:FtsH-binding integral membrane protein n=2 Tax=Kutzneria TaxID=43356 RepID=A0ABR6BTU0_9PSEU|nr:DMT family transporter [Kutzneria albida]AHH94674.1 putative membrane protein [Kutzneria albida DSM 43870]MBA8930342.1 FtsH-binding integral membrane protein [Kutzneria viridogrisea]